MIKDRKEMPQRGIEIDLSGVDGNAFALMKHAQNLGHQLGYSPKRIAAILKVMRMGDYEGLVKVFDREFGHIVTIWR